MVETSQKKKMYSIVYQRKRISALLPENPRKGICRACKRSRAKGEITQTQLHHTSYAYSIGTVKRNPVLAFENTVETDYPCHRIFDAFREILDKTNIERVVGVLRVLPPSQQEKFKEIAKRFIS